MPKGEMKSSTYLRLIKMIIARLVAIEKAVKSLTSLDELTQVHRRTLANYSNEIKAKKGDFEGSIKRLLDGGESTDVDDETLAEHQEKIYTLFTNITSMIEVLVPPEQPASPSASSEPGTLDPVVASQVRLPKLDLQKFSGDITTWVSYINLYDTTIHRNPNLTTIMRYQYLISTLEGEALNLVKGLSLTTANYFVAYELLRQRYHNPRRLVTVHLNSLLDLPQISHTSVKGLRQFVNAFTEHSQAIKALDCEIDFDINPLLSAILLRKMDNELRKKLEAYRAIPNGAAETHSLPSVKDIIDFLNIECTHTEDANLHTSSSKGANFSSPQKCSPKLVRKSDAKINSQKHVSFHVSQDSKGFTPTQASPCFACKRTGHKIYSCDFFRNKSPSDRYQMVKSHSRCVGCLGAHDVKKCSSKNTCFKCQKRHHTLLHFENANAAASSPSQKTSNRANTPPQDSAKNQAVVNFVNKSQNSYHAYTVLLGTALIKVTTKSGNSQVLRALIDSGSMINFISERACQLLAAKRHKSDLSVTGISGATATTKGQTYLSVSSLCGQLISPEEPFHVLDKISANLPRTTLKPEVFAKVKPYVLADPTFHLPGPIDLLIGGSLYPCLIKGDTQRLGPDLPWVLNTHLGYIVIGNAPCIPEVASSANFMSLLSVNNEELHENLQKFWTLEELPIIEKKTTEENLCENFFTETHTRTSEGRYVVRLPFKNSHVSLGSSRIAAEQRLHAIERKFNAQPHFKKLYHDFINEYRALGHMVECENFNLDSPHYFLPHHGVFKESSTTTKLRTVFDASAKTSNGISLNDILMTGPKLQINICDILLHFRTHRYVLSCDIRQMYRQILIHSDDQPYQLILWRDSPQDKISTFKLTTVTYGLNSSPYLAIRTLLQLAEDEGMAFPAAAQVLKTETYVDDVISGVDTEADALTLQKELISLLQLGGFELRKWVSNSPNLLRNVPEEHQETPVFLQEAQEPHFSILGIYWTPTSDSFKYKLDLPVVERPTKRSVLSAIARIYDPCGFLAPFVVLTKCFMQHLWTTGVTWDEPLPPSLTERWNSFMADSSHISDISIPRALNIARSSSIDLHGFADSSETSFACVIYFRTISSSNDVTTRLIISKTRVAPLKRISLPRLELCAAHLLSKLVSHCLEVFKNRITFKNIYLWSDSSVVLTWIKTPPYRLKTFVANRITQIQESTTPTMWHHIPSKFNPADCASRGLRASQLMNHTLWWQGPPFLTLPTTEWPSSSHDPVDLSNNEEIRTTPQTVLTVTQPPEWDIFSRFSKWSTLIRVMAFLLRFQNNCRNDERQIGFLQSSELRAAKLKIFYLIQQSSFSEEVTALRKGHECSIKLRRLKPFIDSYGLLRVGGRLNQTSLREDTKNPIILPQSHFVTHLLIDHCHISHLHAGPQLTQALLTQEVWILNARRVIRSRIFKCIVCFRNKPRMQPPLMGDLPSARVTPARPFKSTGIDYTGPIMAKVFTLRSAQVIKTYICIFICMVTKAVHLEVVTDLTTEAFIAALNRFVSRRGLCTDIYSDCGTNFIGADASLRRTVRSLNSEEINKFSTIRGIQFHFNPPAAPHQGGLWESAVKGCKHHLRRILGNTVLTLQGLITLVTHVEAMLNSRPLTPLSSDPTDLTALTPGHFLIGEPLAAVPEPDFEKTPDNRLRHWQLVSALQQRIWKRWQLEYLHSLQQRQKWTTSRDNLKEGDLVLIHQATPPLSWPLGRIVKIHPGADGAVRVVEVRTASGTLTRPTVKVFTLPSN